MMSEPNIEIEGPGPRQAPQLGQRQSYAGSAYGGGSQAGRGRGGGERDSPRSLRQQEYNEDGPASPYEEGGIQDQNRSPRRKFPNPSRMDPYGAPHDGRYPQFPAAAYNARGRDPYDERRSPNSYRSRGPRGEYDMEDEYDEPYDQYGGEDRHHGRRPRGGVHDRRRGGPDQWDEDERDPYPYDRRSPHDPLGVPYQHPHIDHPQNLAYPEEIYDDEMIMTGVDGIPPVMGGAMSRPSSAMGISRAGSVMGQSRAASVMGLSRPSSVMSRRSHYQDRDRDLERDLDEYGGVRHRRGGRYPEEYRDEYDDYDRGPRRRESSRGHRDSSRRRRGEDSYRRDASYKDSGSRRLSSLQVKFKRKGSFVGGITLRDAQHTALDGKRSSVDGKLRSGGIRLTSNEAYSFEDLHADKRGNIRLKMRWHGYSSLTYEIPLDGRDGQISLQTLARRVARACVHYFQTNTVPIAWERVKLNHLEEVSYGTWQPMLSS